MQKKFPVSLYTNGVVDFSRVVVYNALVYVLMEFREHRNNKS